MNISTLCRQLSAEWRIKVFTGGVITAVFWFGYFTLARAPWFQGTVMPWTAIDRAIPFMPETAFIYLSQFITMPLLTWLMTSRSDLIAYCKATVFVFSVSFLIFFFWPTMVLRQETVTDGPALYRQILRYDTPMNAFPSLHAAFGVLIAGCSRDVFATWRMRRLILAAVWCLTVAVLVSALMTKQHVVLDILGGTVLGTAGYAVYLHLKVKTGSAESKIP